MSGAEPYRAAFFASGRGSNFKAVLEHMQDGSLNAETSFVLSNNSKSQCLRLASESSIPAYHVSTKTEGNSAGVEKKLLELIEAHDPDLLVLAGYMKKIPAPVIRRLPNRLINIHPALLPAFGGEGWYGHYVHEGVIRKGCRYSGITVHVVNEMYDEGAIILQEMTEVIPGESAEELGMRVLKIEHASLWRVIKAYADGVLRPTSAGLDGLAEFRNQLYGTTIS